MDAFLEIYSRQKRLERGKMREDKKAKTCNWDYGRNELLLFVLLLLLLLLIY